MENHIDPSIMLELTEGLTATTALDQNGVYIYVSPDQEHYIDHTARGAIGRKVWEMVLDTHVTEVFYTDKPVFARAVNANDPTFTSYSPRFDRDGKLRGLFFRVIVQGTEDAQNLTRHIGGLSNKVEFYQQGLSREQDARHELDNIIGKSASVLRLKEQTVRTARSTSAVFIEGEMGSGKELVAHSIHAMSARRATNFVRISHSTIPAELMESEFFGYATGTFIGATRKGRIGRFQLTSDDSIFLDEVNLFTAIMQSKFPQVLQEVEIDPVDGEKNIPIDVRVIAVSNIPLETLVETGWFRSDPYYRLNVTHIQTPTLRERKEDPPPLVDNFIHRLNYRPGMIIEGVAPGAMDLLMDCNWPGNVRKLRNVVESAMNTVDPSILRRRDSR